MKVPRSLASKIMFRLWESVQYVRLSSFSSVVLYLNVVWQVKGGSKKMVSMNFAHVALLILVLYVGFLVNGDVNFLI